jgi:hypothetical protein
MTTTAALAPQTRLRWRFADGTAWDELGRPGPSTSSAWSVCLDLWAVDVAGVGGLGC